MCTLLALHRPYIVVMCIRQFFMYASKCIQNMVCKAQISAYLGIFLMICYSKKISIDCKLCLMGILCYE